MRGDASTSRLPESIRGRPLRGLLIYLGCSLVVILTLACGESEIGRTALSAESAGGNLVNEKLAASLRKLAKGRVYFGRHSVGRNILDGIAILAEEYGIHGVNFVDLEEDPTPPLPETFLAHSRIGKNQKPVGKIDGFARRLRNEFSGELDVALMKLCYVDFNQDTAVRELFDHYRATIAQLGRDFPDIRFLHATVPLKERRLGLKSYLKLMLGRGLWGDDTNIKRHEFNEMIERTYDAGTIVDIARVESTTPDGMRVTFRKNDRTYYSLNSSYTDDGGHLNELGKRQVAAEMVRILADNLRGDQ